MIEVFIVAAGAMLCFGLGGVIRRTKGSYIYNESDEGVDVEAEADTTYFGKPSKLSTHTHVPSGEGQWVDGEVTSVTRKGRPVPYKTTRVEK